MHLCEYVNVIVCVCMCVDVYRCVLLNLLSLSSSSIFYHNVVISLYKSTFHKDLMIRTLFYINSLCQNTRVRRPSLRRVRYASLGVRSLPCLCDLASSVRRPVPGSVGRPTYCFSHTRRVIRSHDRSSAAALPAPSWRWSGPWLGRICVLPVVPGPGGAVLGLPALFLNPYLCPCLPQQTATSLSLSPYSFNPIPLFISCPLSLPIEYSTHNYSLSPTELKTYITFND